MSETLQTIGREMRAHAPFTGVGTLTAVVIMAFMFQLDVQPEVSEALFWFFHPLHVLVSAWATTAMYRRHSNGRPLRLFLVGYFGSIGIATLSDSIIPFVGEVLLDLPNRGLHIGALEKWWLVNPLAVAGILLGWRWPMTKLPHASHVLLSTWASLFHMTMASAAPFGAATFVLAATFLFLAVWIPCCMSDIVFPLLFQAPHTHPTAPANKDSAEDRGPSAS